MINLNKEQEYLLALSGGVDSVSMYYNLLNQGFKFKVVHINHHTRASENSCEQLLVEKMCKQDNIDCFVAHFFHQNEGNFHQQAREYRLNIYQKIVKYFDLSGVIIAHHLDDQIENILMYQHSIIPRLLTEQTTYQGMNIYRPWLNITKHQIRKYAKKNGIIYYEDSSNESDKYLRNYVRHHHRLSDEEKREIVSKNLDKIILANAYQEQELGQINYLQASDKQLYLYVQIKKQVEHQISYHLVDDLVQLIDFCGYKEYRINRDYYFIQDYGCLVIRKQEPNIETQTSKECVLGVNEFNGIKFITNHQGMIRTKRPGDKIIYDWGSKKVTRIMIDLKIPKHLRLVWPVIVSGDQVIEVIKPDQVIKE